MITETALKDAIAECQGERNPNANTCMKLASYLTIQEHLFGSKSGIPMQSFSYASSPESQPREGITYKSETDFSRIVYGKDAEIVLEIVDDLMNTLQVLSPRLYRSAMRKFDEI